jgi:hypothetical protein
MAGTLVPPPNGPLGYRPSQEAQAESHCVRGLVRRPAKTSKGNLLVAGSFEQTSDVYTSSTPNAQSGRHPHRPLTSFSAAPKVSSQTISIVARTAIASADVETTRTMREHSEKPTVAQRGRIDGR